ncbi:DNA (cytosine-5-)-methyltransferase [Arthrobacter sp. ATA002]|uniref:DNA cytosine methyltransferase n=1 Tax=Arthrobacter sp. ATA002 TaxID=2991715 RepID=UPI0022A6E0DF|nr:DNA (cytosine-5-)-methyltransferase [Arthrobacter sp. ATA002]WAP51450.1 DNA (cytosine-5-)-methyltransferase [Arthrobacter sp. ATA002]
MNQVLPLPSLSRTTMRAAEFFAGIGLARAGLEPAGFKIVWANDFEPAKKEMYEGNFGTDHDFALGDVAEVSGANLPEDLDFAWASFPCTDLSLAGDRRGLAGKESGTFFHFTRIMAELGDNKPRVVALENVNGLATSHGGDDMAALVRELNALGYSVDVLALDGRRFVPQSRPRIFVVGSLDVPLEDPAAVSVLRPEWLQGVFQDDTLITHRAALPEPPAMLTVGLADVVESMGTRDDRWWEPERKEKFLGSLSAVQLERLNTMKDNGRVSYRTAYRRTRAGVPVWEIRADEISGCLRTARGGSSKQAVVMAGKGRIAVRWMTPVEYARLMGAPDYVLKGLRDNQILFGFGDAVVVPAVQWVAENYLAPLIRGDLSRPERMEKVAG